MYANLENAIRCRGIKKKAIAAQLGITPRGFNKKLAGESSFKWEEVQTIQSSFFPDKSYNYLFSKTA